MKKFKKKLVWKDALHKSSTPLEYFDLMRDCWSEQPDLRPTFERLLAAFKALNGERKVNIVDIMFRQIQAYTNDLEGLVQEKTVKLEEEKKRTDELLSEMLPK